DYQVAIAREALKRNTLVILPTGMGKTVVALLVVADRLAAKPGKVLLLAPTKPLVEQHARFFEETLLDARVATFTGETPPEEREYAWRRATLVCSTPQVVQNDVVAGRVDLADVTLLLVDEAHRAVGNYAYVFLADAYRRQRKDDGLVLALTASPGSKAEKVADICRNLGIEGVEVRTEFDPDTAPYVQETDVEWKEVQVPEALKRVSAHLRQMFDEKVQQLRAVGGLPGHVRFVNKKVLLEAQRIISARIHQGEQDGATGAKRGPDAAADASRLYKALSAQAAALKLSHALELVETQGVGALLHYLERLAQDESKAAKALREDPRMLEVARLLSESRVDHPKLRQVAVLLRQQLKEKPDARIIVFTNYRDTAEALVAALQQVEGVRPARFVGQASRSETDRGMSQKAQIELIERFKAGEFNVLVATSVAEEGLDIPQTDLVVFYEPVPSEIRAIQRRGRTGRKRAGRVVILITKDTRDETYHHASRGKEQKMRREIQELKRFFAKVNASEESQEWRTAYTQGRPASERPLTAFASQEAALDEGPKVTVVADHREFNSAVVRELAKAGLVVRPETLEVGDYVLSDRIAVERKEASDFATSLIDGRLFPQAKALRDAYSTGILVVEGEGLFTARRIGDEAIWSALASLATDFHLSVFMTKDAAETARLLASIARREQQKEQRPLAVRAGKGPMSDDERLRYLVEGLPGVSAVLARRLLEEFGTVREIANAKVEDLRKVEGIGPATAEAIHRIVRTQYVGRPSR
ncbi:MAG TPA: DEAD/DEAH box helicase, partial [Candidatus Thermoplasmatota archaeon]|nr:DEAD/DEAH box helicase [Candidatus Thermoplasmatota archaeon]